MPLSIKTMDIQVYYINLQNKQIVFNFYFYKLESLIIIQRLNNSDKISPSQINLKEIINNAQETSK